MTICEWCEQEMKEAESCFTTLVKFPDGETMPSIPYNENYGGPNQPCHDCSVQFGGTHHPGCDMERCPKCHGQLISCGCLDEDKP